MGIDQEFSEMLNPTQEYDLSSSEKEEDERKKWVEEKTETNWRLHGGPKPRHLWTPFDVHLHNFAHGEGNKSLVYSIAAGIIDDLSRSLNVDQSDPDDLALVQKYTEAVLKWAGERPDNYDLQHLGSGWDGSVFWLSNKKKILKVTQDKPDAEASQILARKPNKELYKVYKVVQVGNDGYAIIAEKLSPLSGSEFQKWERVYHELHGMHKHPSGQKPMTMSWLAEVEEEVEEERWNYPALDEKLGQIAEWVDLLTQRNILIRDFHAGNIMARGRLPIISDLGRARIIGAPGIKKIRV